MQETAANDFAEREQESMEQEDEVQILLEAEPNALRSIFNRDTVFRKDSAVVSLCQKKIHALLFVELAVEINDCEDHDQQLQRVIWRGDLMPAPDGNFIMQKGVVEVIEIGAKCRNDKELEKDEDFIEKCSKVIVLQSHLISRIDAVRLIGRMKDERDKEDTNYSLGGPSTESSIRSPLKGDCDNCFTWVRKMLKDLDIGIEVDPLAHIKFGANIAACMTGLKK